MAWEAVAATGVGKCMEHSWLMICLRVSWSKNSKKKRILLHGLNKSSASSMNTNLCSKTVEVKSVLTTWDQKPPLSSWIICQGAVTCDEAWGICWKSIQPKWAIFLIKWLKIDFWWRSSWSSQWATLQDTNWHCRPPQTLKEKQPKAGEILAFCLWKNVPHQSRRQLMQISVLGNHTKASNMSGDEPDTKRIEKAGSFTINWLSQKRQIRSTLWVLSYTGKNTKY